MKTIKVTRNGRPVTAEELNCAVEGKPLPPLTGCADVKDYHTLARAALLWMWNAYGMDYGDVFKPFRDGKLPQEDLAETLKNGPSYQILCAEERAKGLK